METMLASLGLGSARYCVVSADHERPELYAEEHARQPQTTLERLTDLDNVRDKFSRASAKEVELDTGFCRAREAALGRTLAGGGARDEAGSDGQMYRISTRHQDLLDSADGEEGGGGAPPRRDLVNTLFDRLVQRQSRAEISAFDRQFPLSHRREQPGVRLSASEKPRPQLWSGPAQQQRWSEPVPEWTDQAPAPAPAEWADQAPAPAAAAVGPRQDQSPALIDLS